MDNLDFSLYHLLDEYYESKRRYYGDGKSDRTDSEFDALEGSIKAIHGEDTFEKWDCVGYDAAKHQVIRTLAAAEMKKFKDYYNNKELRE